MDIVAMNVRIEIEKNTVVTDGIGNRSNEWIQHFVCYATVSGTSGGGQFGAQENAAGVTSDHTELSFTVRYCNKTAAVSVTGYRIRFHGQSYDIIAIDPMNFKRKCLKFRCRKESR